jgi:hypothetical protein
MRFGFIAHTVVHYSGQEGRMWAVSNAMERSALSERRNTMNWSIKELARILLVVAVLSGATLFGSSNVWAQEKGSTFAEQIQGTWVLVSIYNEQDGKKVDVFGPNPRGLMILTPDGHFEEIMMRASLPKFASGNRTKGTVEENQAVVQGSFVSFGTYTVASDKEQTVIKHIEGGTFPNFDGQDQKRFCAVIGDELRVTNPTPTTGSGTNFLVWKRAK